jgi:exosortase
VASNPIPVSLELGDSANARSGLTSARAAWILAGVSFAWLYQDVAVQLVRDWTIDENYSHGFLVVPLASYFAWERRTRLAMLPIRASRLGLVVILFSLAVMSAGALGAEMFLARISMVGVLAGTVLFVWGAGHLRLLIFPLAFLLLMVPLPALIFNQIAFPLQLVASQFGETTLRIIGVPVLREGNLIVLANTTLEVAEACSGIRSLVSLLTLGIVFGYFIDHRRSVRVAVAIATIPVAVAANGARIAGTGIAATFYGAGAAEGFFHTFSGWLVFGTAFAMLMVSHHLTVHVVSMVERFRRRPCAGDGHIIVMPPGEDR